MENKNNRHNRIEEEVQKTLNSLDHVKPAKTDPFFYSRLEAKLESRDDTATVLNEIAYMPRFSLALAAVILMVMLNIVSIIYYGNRQSAESPSQTEVELFLDEYEIEPPLVYDLTNEAD